MFVYVLLIFMASVFALFEMAYPDSERLKRWMVGISSFVMIILAGFRLDVGADWPAYYEYHVMATYMPFGEFVATNDVGYTAPSWIFARLGLDIWSINLLCATLLVVGISVLASTLRYRNLFFLSAIPYLLIVVGMGYSRQSAAIGMVSLSLYFAFQARRANSGVFALASLVFHKSAAVGILPVLLTFGKKRWHAVAIGVVGAPLVLYFVVMATLENVRTDYLEGTSYNSTGALIRLAQFFLCGIWFLIFLRKREPDSRRGMLTIMGILAILFIPALVVSPSSTLVDRMALYLLPFQCYVLARTPEKFVPGGSRTLAYLLVIFINLAIFGVWMTTSDTLHSWIPYKNYLWSPVHQ